jgi:photosystem II stability/assembly factor-like uncharacterized protein
MRRPLFLILCLLALPVAVHAQWQIVANRLLPNSDKWFGATAYKDGTIWVGADDLYYSDDTGRTWKKSNFNASPSQVIYDINFLNANLGVVGGRQAILKTTDHGQSWTDITPPFSSGFCRVAVLTDKIIIASSLSSPQVMKTTDGGLQWEFIGSSAVTFATDRNDGLFVPWPGARSSDIGATWDSMYDAPADIDSYSIEVDACNSQYIYILNENYASPGDNISKIVTSSNRGRTWSASFQHPIKYLSGGMAVSLHSVFAGTAWDGILRSTDFGATWIHCATQSAGPSIVVDCRGICPINDNLIFALDSLGNIWMTENCGGDSVRTSDFPVKSSVLLSSPDSLFETDSIFVCPEEFVTRSVELSASGCNAPSVKGTSIVGTAAGSYAIVSSSADDIRLRFQPQSAGLQSAQLLLNLSNGRTDTVSLAGVGLATTPLHIQTADQTIDTLGAEAWVPITIEGLSHWADVDLVVHYDSALEYLGTFSPIGGTLDVSGQRWPGHAQMATHTKGGMLAGYARFRCFKDSADNPSVTFDSLRLLERLYGECEYQTAPAAVSAITLPGNCITPIISRFLRTSSLPTLSIYPNPASHDVNVISSSDIADAQIEVYDMLGAKRFAAKISLLAETPLLLQVNLPEGLYYLRVQSRNRESDLQFVVE